MADPLIFDAVRTPRAKGKADGALASIRPHQLVTALVDALRERHGEAIEEAARLSLGCVGQVDGQGGHIALVSRLAADLPSSMVATTINNYCVSSLSAIGGELSRGSRLALAGGLEHMSSVPFLADRGAYYSDPELAAKLRFVPVALAADRLATVHDIGRGELDAVTLDSHRKAAAAWSEARFTGAVIAAFGCDRDELVRPDLDLEKLAALPPAFAELGASGYDDVMVAATDDVDSIEHRHSVANCPGVCDGAALVMIGDVDAGLRPRARVLAFAEAAADPIEQLTAGNIAMRRALATAGMRLADCGRIEYMEAFAATIALFLRENDALRDRVNVDGGHLAMGHPMGASGAILVSQLLDVIERDDVETGLVVAHGGAGVGAAMIIERV